MADVLLGRILQISGVILIIIGVMGLMGVNESQVFNTAIDLVKTLGQGLATLASTLSEKLGSKEPEATGTSGSSTPAAGWSPLQGLPSSGYAPSQPAEYQEAGQTPPKKEAPYYTPPPTQQPLPQEHVTYTAPVMYVYMYPVAALNVSPSHVLYNASIPPDAMYDMLVYYAIAGCPSGTLHTAWMGDAFYNNTYIMVIQNPFGDILVILNNSLGVNIVNYNPRLTGDNLIEIDLKGWRVFLNLRYEVPINPSYNTIKLSLNEHEPGVWSLAPIDSVLSLDFYDSTGGRLGCVVGNVYVSLINQTFEIDLILNGLPPVQLDASVSLSGIALQDGRQSFDILGYPAVRTYGENVTVLNVTVLAGVEFHIGPVPIYPTGEGPPRITFSIPELNVTLIFEAAESP
jgi:hypothetical protein